MIIRLNLNAFMIESYTCGVCHHVIGRIVWWTRECGGTTLVSTTTTTKFLYILDKNVISFCELRLIRTTPIYIYIVACVYKSNHIYIYYSSTVRPIIKIKRLI